MFVKKARTFVNKIRDFHGASTTALVVGGNYFTVGREIEITLEGFGRIHMNEIMMYEVKDGEIVSGQFFLLSNYEL